MKLIEKMKAMEKRLPTLEEDDQDTSGMETQSSLEMLEAEQENERNSQDTSELNKCKQENLVNVEKYFVIWSQIR